MSAALTPYSVSLTAASPLFSYTPFRDGSINTSWNSFYTGGTTAPRAIGVGGRQTLSPGAGLSFTYEGTGFYICFTPNVAHYTLKIDGSIADTAGFKGSAGTPCESTTSDSIFTTDSLKYGAHDITLSVESYSQGAGAFQFFGGGFTLGLDTKGGAANDGTVIDDQDSAWAIVPGRLPVAFGWDTSVEPGLYRNSGTFTCPYGGDGPNSISYTFTGASGVILKGYVWPDTHAFSVALDGQTFNMDATSSFFDNTTVLLAKGNLDPAALHKVSLINWNSDQPACTTKDGLGNAIVDAQGNSVDAKGNAIGRYCCVGLDSLVLLKAGSSDASAGSPSSTSPAGNGKSSETQDPGSGGGGGSSPVGAIVGGVLGGLALGVVAGFLFLLMRRRRKRRASGYTDFRTPDVYMDDYAAEPWVGKSAQGTVSNLPPSLPLETTPYAPLTTTGSSSNNPQRSTHNLNPLKGAAAPLPPGPSGASGPSSGPQLAQEDLERVLAFVAQRMDQNTPAQHPAPHDNDLPQYSRS